jgi:hypothetical protein
MRNSKSPYATAVLVLGISSIALSCCYGIPGILTGIISLVLYKREKRIYENIKSNYRSIENLNTGRLLSIIGICISTLYMIYLLFVVSNGNQIKFSDPVLILKELK